MNNTNDKNIKVNNNKANKAGAVACTILFTVVFYAVLIFTAFIGTEDGRSLFDYISFLTTGYLSFFCVYKFYEWVSN